MFDANVVLNFVFLFSTELSLHKFQKLISFLDFEYLSCSHLSIKLIKLRIFARILYRVAGPHFAAVADIFHRLPWLFPPSSYFPLLSLFFGGIPRPHVYSRDSRTKDIPRARNVTASLSLSGQFFLRKRGWAKLKQQRA